MGFKYFVGVVTTELIFRSDITHLLRRVCVTFVVMDSGVAGASLRLSGKRFCTIDP